jgi:hypothetical protein
VDIGTDDVLPIARDWGAASFFFSREKRLCPQPTQKSSAQQMEILMTKSQGIMK